MAHILVVEDNPMDMELVEDLLGLYEYEVTGAEDGVKALECVKEIRFDLILLDMQLPKIHGLEVLAKFKSSPETADIPVVAVTAHAMQGDEERFIEAGCAGYISKPIDIHQFKAAITHYLVNKSTS